MRVLKFAWHLFWAARRLHGQGQRPTLVNLIVGALVRAKTAPGLDLGLVTDTELTEALRRYGR